MVSLLLSQLEKKPIRTNMLLSAEKVSHCENMTPSLQNSCGKLFSSQFFIFLNFFAIFDIWLWQEVTCELHKTGRKLFFSFRWSLQCMFLLGLPIHCGSQVKNCWLTNIAFYTNQSPLFKDAYSHSVKKPLETHFVFTVLLLSLWRECSLTFRRNLSASRNISSRFRSFKRNVVNSELLML